MKIDLYSQSGEKKGTIEIPKEIFEVPFNENLIHQALIRQLANKRISIAHTKTRGNVRGGGRKPFRQKGTGNARQGTIRSPLLRGGGIIFGPSKKRNFSKDMPKKQRRKALFSALSEKARNNEIIALESYEDEEMKTKKMHELLQKLQIERNVLIIIPGKNTIIQKASNNLPYTKTILTNYINIHDLQKYKKVLFLKESIEKLKEIYLK